MNTYKRILLIAFLIVVSWSFSAYAAIDKSAAELELIEEIEVVEVITLESVARQFGLTVDALEYRTPTYMPEMERFELASMSDFIAEASRGIDYSMFGEFSLSSGFDHYENTTFACEKTLVGQGVDGMTIGVAVYTIDTVAIEGVDDEMTEYETVYNLGYSSVKSLGASGLYNEIICLEENTVQYVSVMVQNGYEAPMSRTFKVTTLESSTKKILENIEINFIEEVEIEDEEPLIDSFIDWFGIDQEIEF